MEPTPAGLADTDGELWAAAVDLLAKRYRHERHEVAAMRVEAREFRLISSALGSASRVRTRDEEEEKEKDRKGRN